MLKFFLLKFLLGSVQVLVCKIVQSSFEWMAWWIKKLHGHYWQLGKCCVMLDCLMDKEVAWHYWQLGMCCVDAGHVRERLCTQTAIECLHDAICDAW